MSNTTTNPYATAGAVLNKDTDKAGRFRQLKGKSQFGEALLKVLPNLNRAWEIKNGKYTGRVKIKYFTKSGEYKESLRSKQELINHLVSVWALAKLS